MATYLTQEGYNKKMEELSALEAQRPLIKQAIADEDRQAQGTGGFSPYHR